MSKFVGSLVVVFFLALVAAATVTYMQNEELLSLDLYVCTITQARMVELLASAFGLGVLFGWLTVWWRNCRRAARERAAQADSASEELSQELVDSDPLSSLDEAPGN